MLVLSWQNNICFKELLFLYKISTSQFQVTGRARGLSGGCSEPVRQPTSWVAIPKDLLSMQMICSDKSGALPIMLPWWFTNKLICCTGGGQKMLQSTHVSHLQLVKSKWQQYHNYKNSCLFLLPITIGCAATYLKITPFSVCCGNRSTSLCLW